MGKLIAINISPKRGTEKKEVKQAELVANYGIMQDAHAGKWHRQVSLLSAEKIDDFKAKGAQIENGAFGENLIVSGIDFKNLPLGTRFKIGESILEMTQIGKECHSHCAIFQRMGECIMPKDGVFAVVIKGGTIHPGDDVEMIPANIYASIKDRPADSKAIVTTVISGPHTGQKALVLDDRIRVAIGEIWSDNMIDEIMSATAPDGLRKKESVVKLNEDRIFVQELGSRPQLIICGGGHVSAALVRMAAQLSFEIWVIDDRPIFADNAKRAGADHVICGDYAESLKEIPDSRDNYYVCMTRGHRFDLECLGVIFKRAYAYVGMMGSKKRAVMVRKSLEESGISQKIISGLHSPIGLPIGGQTPEEIALSVISEVVKCKNERLQSTQVDKDVIEELVKMDKASDYHMLCTIIRKNGSAPRGIGTQMLVRSDNRITGTIGGGCAEAEVISRCRKHFHEIMRGEEFVSEVMEVSMTTDNAEKEGMVCGGNITVLIELC